MAIENLKGIMEKKQRQYGDQFGLQREKKEENTDGLKLLFEYMKASNDKILSICKAMIQSQQEILNRIDKIEKKIESE